MTERAEKTKKAYENGEPVLAIDLMNLVNEEHDKKKAEEYIKANHSHIMSSTMKSIYSKIYLDGLAEGRKENKAIEAAQKIAIHDLVIELKKYNRYKMISFAAEMLHKALNPNSNMCCPNAVYIEVESRLDEWLSNNVDSDENGTVKSMIDEWIRNKVDSDGK